MTASLWYFILGVITLANSIRCKQWACTRVIVYGLSTRIAAANACVMRPGGYPGPIVAMKLGLTGRYLATLLSVDTVMA